MNQRFSPAVFAILALLTAVGCASNDAVVSKESSPAASAVATQPATAPDGSKSAKNITNAIAAVVNDEIITLYDVNRAAKPFFAEAEKKGTVNDKERAAIRRNTLDRLIEKKLTEQKIKELGIKVSEEEIRQAIDDIRKQNNIPSEQALTAALANQGLSFDQYRSQLKEQIEKLKLVSMEVRAKIQVGESEMRDYYAANLARYAEEESYRARHIFFKPGDKANPDELQRSKANAIAVLAEARTGKDFAELAVKFSEDPAARKDGGDLGSFKKGDMQPELEKAILALKPGEISDLVSTNLGFHIIKLEARIDGAKKPFESVKADIEEFLYKEKSEERFSQWAKDLRGKASIEIRDLNGLL